MSAVMSLIAQLQDADPDTDLDTLREAIESETDANELLARVIRVYLEAEAFGDAIDGRMKVFAQRRDRYRRREQSAKLTAFAIMDALGETRFTDPEFTATIGKGRQSVQITDGVKLPAQYVKIERVPLKVDIAEALKSGEAIDGAELADGMPTLTIRKV